MKLTRQDKEDLQNTAQFLRDASEAISGFLSVSGKLNMSKADREELMDKALQATKLGLEAALVTKRIYREQVLERN